MRKLMTNIVALGIAMGLGFATAPADEAGKSATVNVAITVLPYASVTLNESSRTITISEAKTTLTVEVGGTVTCNCNVRLYSVMANPTGVTSGWAWTATTKVGSGVLTPGTYAYTGTGNNLLTVIGSGSEVTSGEVALTFAGQSLPKGSSPPEGSSPAGSVLVTVIPD